MLTDRARGVYIISATPFADNGAIDFASTDRLVDFYAGAGVDGITVLGMMGEAGKLEQSEAIAFTRHVVKRAGKLPVVAGVSAPGFAAMSSLARAAMDVGAAGVMIAPASTCRTDDQIFAYYTEAVDAIGPDVPFALQDYPLSIGVNIAPKVIERIVNALPSCVVLKHEDWPGLEKITTLRAAEKAGTMRRISILCGNGGLFLDHELGRGADGANTGYAFPEMLVAVVRMVQAGQRDDAHDLFDAHLPLVRYEQQPGVGLAVRKYVLWRRGVIASEAQRRPVSRLTPAARADVDYLLSRLARRDPAAARLIG